MNYAEAIMTLI